MPPAHQSPDTTASTDGEAETHSTARGSARQRLVEARERLDARDSAAALAIYEELLADESGGAGARADVLVTISGDLGSTGHLREITEIVGPRYDAQKHGPATGLNLLQAYIALRNVDAAQHILDILFGLGRPELEERLHGFSNAIAELMAQGQFASDGPISPSVGPEGGALDASVATQQNETARVNLVTISKPIWSYGLEDALGELFPAREGAKGVRRVAFAQLALPGLENIMTLAAQPEEEMGRLSRAIPLWLAETFSYSPLYAPLAAIGVQGTPGQPGHYALFANEWTTDNLRQLVESAAQEGAAGGAGGLDYIFTGALQQRSGDYTLTLRVWEVRKFRERKKIVLRWTPATADAELSKLHAYLRQFMEWREGPEGREAEEGGASEGGSPPAAPLRYAAPTQPSRWLDTLGTSLTLFLASKNVLDRGQVPPLDAPLRAAVDHATGTRGTPEETATALAALTLLARARELGTAEPATLEELTATLRESDSPETPPLQPLLTQALSALDL
ncbi:hypothetical protein [Cephaloticoccus primus]|uniref:hypothetical protein n=1 Tax=Cephaloticoccus primus TaxID=1548207 RepID=UPI0012E95B63|nr:hypothetical protein [Cephaloticoccus primus]